MDDTLRVTEIFRSIQGETSYVGLPCVFIRLAGCNLHCVWCDSRYAADDKGTEMSVENVVHRADRYGSLVVCVTGGEPLLQPAMIPLVHALVKLNHIVLVETNGSLDISVLPHDAVRVMDVKCPGSGECGTTLESNIEALRPHDEVKFVLLDRWDFGWAVEYVRGHELIRRCHVLFSPVVEDPESFELGPEEGLDPRALAEWILESGLEVRLQVQLHKLLWPDKPRGV